eukprot:g4524.t1
MKSRVVDLRGRAGQYRLPEVDTSSGLIAAIVNRTRTMRGGDTGVGTPLFTVSAFSRRGDVLCAVSQHGQVFALFVRQNRFECIKHIGVAPTSIVASSLRNYEFLVGFADGSVRCFDVGAPAVISTLSGHKGAVMHVDVHRDGEYALTASRESVILWNTSTWERVRVLGGGVGMAQSSFVGDSVSVYFLDGTFMAWSVETLELTSKLLPPDAASSASPTCFAVSDDGSALATASDSVSVHVWELASQTLLRVVKLPQGSRKPSQMLFLPGTKTLAALSANGSSVVVADISHPKCKVLLDLTPCHGATTAHVAVGPQGRHLAACCSDGTIQLYDLNVATRTQRRAAPGKVRSGGARAQAERELQVHSATDDVFAENGEENGDSEQQQQPAVTPLHRLAQLEPSARRLNRRRLRALLRRFGEFPSKYRPVVWRFLLRLPENREAFSSLVQKGTHPAFAAIGQKFPVQSRRLLTKLQRVLSCLAHWSPVLAQVPYLPALTFPFVKFYGADEVAAFETVMSLVVHWCDGWLDMFPHPPVPVLNVAEALLESHDPELLQHFVQHGVNAQTFAWSLLRSLFSEVLASADWLRLWDTLLSHPNDPALLVVTVVAFLRYFRISLLAAKTPADFEGFFHSQCAVDMPVLLSGVHALRRASSDAQLRAVRRDPLQSTFSARMASVVTPAMSVVSRAAGGAAGSSDDIAAQQPKPMWPLREGGYPSFHRYPKTVVDYQIQQRDQMQIEEEELERKRQLDELLRSKKRELQEQEEAWRRQHEAIKLAEETAMREMQEQQRRFAQEKQNVEQSIRAQRMEEAARMEERAKERLVRQAETRALQQGRLEAELERLKTGQEAMVKTQLEEEALRNLESQASQRAVAVMEQHDMEEQLLQHKHELLAREKQQKLSERLLQERWRAEDEEQQLKANLRRAAVEKRREAEEQLQQRLEMDSAFQLASIERDVKLQSVERERRLRRVAEEQGTALDDAEADAKKEDGLRAKEREFAAATLAKQEAEWRRQKAQQRMAIVEQERQRLALETEKRQRMIRDLELRQRRRQFEDKLRATQELETEEGAREEKQMQAMLLELEDERRKHKQMHLDLILEAQATEDKLAFARAQRESEAEIIARERARFDQSREQARAQQEESMAQRVKQYSKQTLQSLEARDRQLLGQRSELRGSAQLPKGVDIDDAPDSDDEDDSLSPTSSDDSANLVTQHSK